MKYDIFEYVEGDFLVYYKVPLYESPIDSSICCDFDNAIIIGKERI